MRQWVKTQGQPWEIEAGQEELTGLNTPSIPLKWKFTYLLALYILNVLWFICEQFRVSHHEQPVNVSY